MRWEVDISDTITLVNSGIDGAQATAVGSPPHWDDDSDGTYIEVDGAYFGPGEPQFFARATAAIPAQDLSAVLIGNPNLKLFMQIRVAGSHAGLPFPQARVDLASAGTRLTPISAPTTISASPETLEVELGGDIVGLANQPSQHIVEVEAATLTPAPGSMSGYEIRSWRVYELRLFFEVLSYVAPPCRLFPRADGLGVGGGRHFPPPKSRQRSARRFGYY